MRLLQGTAVGHQLLHHIPVHQRLSAEEIHLQVNPVSGVGHQEIQGLLSHLVGHKGSSSVVLALLGEAVLAGQVAVVGNVEAERLHHRFSLLKINYIVLVDVCRKELFHIDQLLNIGKGFLHILSRICSL